VPYIKRFRELFNPSIVPDSCGELNYLITKAIHRYIQKRGLCYSVINEVIGVFECCKLELYRQIAAKYEDEKKKENGSISELDK